MIYDKDAPRADDDEMLDDDLEFDLDEQPENTVYSADEPSPDTYPADPGEDSDDADDSDTSAPEQPEPSPETKGFRHKESIFRFRRDDDSNDYFDGDDSTPESETEPRRKVKTPRLDPEDPDYWIEEESPISSIIPKPGNAWKWWLTGIIVALAAIAGVWMLFMLPYSDNSIKYGYLKHMERRGTVMKTFEGVLIPYRELGDPTPTYFEEFPFSVESDSLAARMKAMMLGCVPVRLEYETYRSPLPWKGEQRVVVTKADTADTSKILPPEYR